MWASSAVGPECGFSPTDKLVPGDDLYDHLGFAQKPLYPAPGDDSRMTKLRTILERSHVRAHITCFGAATPAKPTAYPASI